MLVNWSLLFAFLFSAIPSCSFLRLSFYISITYFLCFLFSWTLFVCVFSCLRFSVTFSFLPSLCVFLLFFSPAFPPFYSFFVCVSHSILFSLSFSYFYSFLVCVFSILLFFMSVSSTLLSFSPPLYNLNNCPRLILSTTLRPQFSVCSPFLFLFRLCFFLSKTFKGAVSTESDPLFRRLSLSSVFGESSARAGIFFPSFFLFFFSFLTASLLLKNNNKNCYSCKGIWIFFTNTSFVPSLLFKFNYSVRLFPLSLYSAPPVLRFTPFSLSSSDIFFWWSILLMLLLFTSHSASVCTVLSV